MGISEELMLLGLRESPYENRVQFALNLKSLDYEFVQEKNRPIEKSELLLKSIPVHKKIPLLIHTTKSKSESLVIVEYIDDVWRACPSILPSDPYVRANARFWAAYVDLTVIPAIRELRSTAQDDEESKKVAIEKVNECIILLEDVFVKSSKGKAFFGGDEIGYLDIVFGCILGWLKVTEILNNVKVIDEVKAPRLSEWVTVFLSHEATKNVIPDPQELIEFFKNFQARLAAGSN